MTDNHDINEFTRENAERAYNKIGELCDKLEKTRRELLDNNFYLFDLTLRRPRFCAPDTERAKARYDLEGVKNTLDDLTHYLVETREILAFLQERI
jgi:hypothetical protein